VLVVEKMVDPLMGENAYIVYKEGAAESVVIDPSFQIEAILRYLKEESLSCGAILLTHGHFDHMAGVDTLRKETGASVYIHERDADKLTDAEKNMSIQFGAGLTTEPAEHLLTKDETVLLAGLQIKVLSTPGHSLGSVCYIIEDVIFSGDTLFNMSIGRTDFDDSDQDEMFASLHKLKALEGEYLVHPGHASSTSLQYEISNNPFLGDEKWSL
jgi:hydroxyacylglutathione hydrolase